MYDVAILGGGITGAAVAFALAKYQLSVAVLERENDVACGTTKANSAILHAGYDPRPGTLMARLNVPGARAAATLCAALDVPYRKVGSLVLGFSPKDRKTLEGLLQNGLANGVEDLELLCGDALRALEPGVSPLVTDGLYAPSAAICSPWEFCLALMETAVQNGTTLFLERGVTGLCKSAEGWRVETNQGPLEARFVVNAAGVAAGQIHALAFPPAFTVRPRRGQYFLLDKSEGDSVNHIIFQCPGPDGKGVLVAPTVHGNLIVGPSSEPVSGEDTETTADGLSAVQAQAARAVPGIRFGENIRNFAGVRAATDRGDFIVESPGEGFLDVAGIGSPGLSAAPALGEYAAKQLARMGLVLTEKRDFTPTRKRLRFSALTPAEQAALVAQHPAYGRVVCRCETVTEGEILDCLSAPIPPRSVDGVKRRVGTGMGRCQGGFCGPRVLELLARELHCSPGAILQDGPGSEILTEETKRRV